MSDDLLLAQPVGQSKRKPKPTVVRVYDLDISLESMIRMTVKFWFAQIVVYLGLCAVVALLSALAVFVISVLGALMAAGAAGAM